MISVSVAMATYNGERFIREQLDSLAAQRHLPSELVITDDVSTDGTVPIAQQFAKAAPFKVHIHRNDTRLGYRANFMRAASLCTSELIAFCDQDDIWSPRKLALCIKPFQNPAVLLAYHNAEVVNEAGEPFANLDHFASPPMMPPLSSCPMRDTQYALGFTQVFRRSILELSDLWEMSLDYKDLRERLAHDQWVFFISSVFGSVVYRDQALVSYRQHGCNLTGWARPTSIYDFRSVFYNPSDQLISLQQATARFAEILEKSKYTVADAWHDRAAEGAARYRLLAEFYTARNEIYTSTSLAKRVQAFRRIILTGGYRPKRGWGLGRKALARDICLGLPAGHLLRSDRVAGAAMQVDRRDSGAQDPDRCRI
jgi:glycosyltransferase involved in cell wall biosynthesis